MRLDRLELGSWLTTNGTIFRLMKPIDAGGYLLLVENFKGETRLMKGDTEVTPCDAPDEGKKYDEGKPMMGLLPFKSLAEVSKVLTFGAKKYAAHNWKKVEPERYLDAALRHLGDYLEGEDDDSESGLSHLAHAGCCVLFALWHHLEGRPARHED